MKDLDKALLKLPDLHGRATAYQIFNPDTLQWFAVKNLVSFFGMMKLSQKDYENCMSQMSRRGAWTMPNGWAVRRWITPRREGM